MLTDAYLRRAGEELVQVVQPWSLVHHLIVPYVSIPLRTYGSINRMQ
jgi:hypothetical protein